MLLRNVEKSILQNPKSNPEKKHSHQIEIEGKFCKPMRNTHENKHCVRDYRQCNKEKILKYLN